MIYLGAWRDRNKVFIYLLFQLTEVQPTTYFLRKGKETEGLESDIINCTFWEQEFKWHSRNLGKSPLCSSPLKSLRITQSKVPITEAHHFPALRYPKFEAKSLSFSLPPLLILEILRVNYFIKGGKVNHIINIWTKIPYFIVLLLREMLTAP